MIPKTIHYCWFSNEKIPPFLENCMETWKKQLPDFTIRLWDHNSFDFDSVPFVKQAFEKKKWAFVTDYIRFHALYTEGGVYMDTDVKVLRPFNDDWFNFSFFSAHEYHPGLFDTAGVKKLNDAFLPIQEGEDIDGFSIQAAIMASAPENPFMKDCLNEYNNIDFLLKDGSINKTNIIIIGAIISRVAEKYGYVYQNKKQVLKNNMIIFPSNVLVGNAVHLDSNSYAIHLINGSWLEKKGYEKFMHKIRNNYPNFFPLFHVFNKIRLKLLRFVK